MIKNPEILQEFENRLSRENNSTFAERLKIFEDMLLLKLKLCPENKDPLEGLDRKIEFIKRLHNAGKTSH